MKIFYHFNLIERIKKGGLSHLFCKYFLLKLLRPSKPPAC